MGAKFAHGNCLKTNNFENITLSEYEENDYFLVKYCVNNGIFNDPILFYILNKNIFLVKELKHKLVDRQSLLSLRLGCLFHITSDKITAITNTHVPEHILTEIKIILA